MRSAFIQAILCFLVVLMACAGLHAQSSLVIVEKYPAEPVPNTWYYFPSRFLLYYYDGVNLTSRNDIKTAYLCGGTLVIETYGSFSKYTLLGYYDGMTYSHDRVAFCSDSISVFESPGQFDFVGPRSKLLLRIYRNNCSWALDTLTVQGMRAFCIPKVPTGLYNENCDEVHSWGILGSNGRWLIEPIYDAPFRFVNGIAEVMHYRQKRKINERGEYLD